jgi:cell division protein FtsQ
MKAVKIAGIVVVSLLVTGAIAYVGYSLLSFSSIEKDIKCADVEVVIQSTVPFINEDEVHLMLRERGLHPIGVSVPELQTDHIERFLRENPYVKKVKCFHDPSGKVMLHMELRRPLFLVSGNETYYLDDEGIRLPAKPGVMAYVPVITGRVTKTMLQEELYGLVSFIAGHEFWNAQIQQIHVRDDHRIELVPRVGDALIMLGTISGYELKLDRLFRLYQQAFNVMGWNSYRMLDLQFKNQIVAVKN